ncbi:MAG: CapA family protein [Adlercreutzia equolifaciens]
MYAKPTCPTPLKILLVVVIVVELAAIGLLLAGRAGASEGRDSAVEASASTTPAPTDTPAAPAASDGGETAGGDKASSEPVTLTVTFAGDCTLGTDINYENERSFNSRWQAEEGDATYFLRNVADLFGSDDLTVVNMEGALTEGGERADKKFAFRGKPEYAKIFSSASGEAATLANNHSQDYGQTGYDDTIAALDAEGVQSFGYDRIAYLDVKGVKVALIGSYFPEDSAENTKEMTDNIAAARAEGAQLVIVYVHWGQEHEYDITEGQQAAGRAAIDAGADLVVGSHPHVVQGWEVYQAATSSTASATSASAATPTPTTRTASSSSRPSP